MRVQGIGNSIWQRGFAVSGRGKMHNLQSAALIMHAIRSNGADSYPIASKQSINLHSHHL